MSGAKAFDQMVAFLKLQEGKTLTPRFTNLPGRQDPTNPRIK